MEEIYANVDDVKTLSSRLSTIQEGLRRFLGVSVLGLGLLSVFLLAGLIVLAVHYHNSVGGAAADLSSVTEERDNLIARLQANDQELSSVTELNNQLNVNLTKKTREVDRLQCLMDKERTCPGGWEKLNCSCYLLSPDKASWEQSRNNCRAGAADLVIVDSKEEQEFIVSMIKEDTWIGLSDREEDATWKWVDGSLLTLNLTFWSYRQPDNKNGEDCVEIATDFNNEWNDRACEDYLPWICEI